MKGAPETKKYLFVERILKREIILDIGGGKPWETGWIHKKYRSILERKKQAYCCDMDPNYHPHILADVKKLPFKDENIDGIICNAVLEHVKYPQEAINEMYRVLKKGGECVLYTPWIYRYHKAPNDYYRFSEPALRHLLRSFDIVELYPSEFGDYPPNAIYCLLGLFPIPDRWYNLFIRLALRPLYVMVRGLLLLLLLLKAVFATKPIQNWHLLNTKLDALLVENWTHGYWCWCKKGENPAIHHLDNTDLVEKAKTLKNLKGGSEYGKFM
jgi:SAM-dependent methyltransferase